MNISDAIFPPHGTISTAEKRSVQQRTLYFVWHCDFTSHRPSSLVVVHDCLYCILYFVLKIQRKYSMYFG